MKLHKRKERRQRMEWICARREDIRKGDFCPRGMLELIDLGKELAWWEKR